MAADGHTPVDREALDRLYAKYNRREFVAPDPLELLYRYEDPADREVAGLVSSVLAYGRVVQIVRSAVVVLGAMPSPCRFLRQTSAGAMRRRFSGFRHRFTSGEEIAAMLLGAKSTIGEYGSLEACFVDGLGKDDETVAGALGTFVRRLTARAPELRKFLLPSPEDGSACKRLNLYLRWMVRRDDVDLGGWERVSARKLIVPLDTHLHRIGRRLGLTKRRAADLRTALEITGAFRGVIPEDPVRYDFALTRLGIRPEADLAEFLNGYRFPEAA